jgi:hypothetical protein
VGKATRPPFCKISSAPCISCAGIISVFMEK